MGTAHNNAKKGDFANVVLMPGDPKRAELIVKKYLVDYKIVTDVRGIQGYTGYTRNGKKVSVMASGMGLPSIGIYSYELYSLYDVDIIIRVGSCGGYQENVKLLDLIICSAASTNSNWAKQYNLQGTWSANADFDLLISASKACEKLGYPYHGGNVLSSDTFYNSDPEAWKKWAEMGVLAVEMESYALYANAARLNKKALCILTVSDSLVYEQYLTPEQRERDCMRMVDVAIEVAEEYAKESR